MMKKNELIRALETHLKQVGFERKSTTWYLDEPDLIKVINLQKSNYSNLYYVNLSIYLKGLGNKDQYPKEPQCHIRTRLSRTIVNLSNDYDYLFDLENLKIDEERYNEEMKECVQKNIIPQLELIKSKEGILKIATRNPAILNILSLKVKAYFNL